MRSVLVIGLALVALAGTEAQSPVPPVSLAGPLPADRPVRLLAVQQLAMAAYPELRMRGLQTHVEETAQGATVTIAFAEHDRDTVLALSRPRAVQLVIEGTFDTLDALTGAVLRGMLAHTKERRDIGQRPSGWTQALDNAGAAFSPTNEAAFRQQLDLRVVTPITGTLAVQRTQFQIGLPTDGLYWEVATTSVTGEVVTLGFEPFAGRLVRFARGAAR
jgi:hypothetical protein